MKKVIFLTQFQKSAFYICLKSFVKLSRFQHTDFNIQKQSPNRPELFCNKGVLRNLAELTGKHRSGVTEGVRWVRSHRPREKNLPFLK